MKSTLEKDEHPGKTEEEEDGWTKGRDPWSKGAADQKEQGEGARWSQEDSESEEKGKRKGNRKGKTKGKEKGKY